MGSVIEAVGLGRPAGRGPQSSVRLATRAARAGLARAGWAAADLDVLVNTGVYRDRNIVEPAMAPFIQHRLGANLGVGDDEAGRSTFSFDLANGACGLLQALQVVDGMLASGRARRALVVTSDVDPRPGVSEGLAFDPLGAAVLVRRGGEGEGFRGFDFESFPKHSHLFDSAIRFVPEGEGPRGPANRVLSRFDADYLEKCVECAHALVRRFLGGLGLVMADLDLVAPSQFPAGFPRAFARRAGLEPEQLAEAAPGHGVPYTAGPVAALEACAARPRTVRAGCTLFVAAGAGIDVGVALYAGVPSLHPRA